MFFTKRKEQIMLLRRKSISHDDDPNTKRDRLPTKVRSTKFPPKIDKAFTKVLNQTGSTPAQLLRTIVSDWMKQRRLTTDGNEPLQSAENSGKNAAPQDLQNIAESLRQIQSTLAQITQSNSSDTQFPTTPMFQQLHDRIQQNISTTAQEILAALSETNQQLSIHQEILENVGYNTQFIYPEFSNTFGVVWTIYKLLRESILEPQLTESLGDPQKAQIRAEAKINELFFEGLKRFPILIKAQTSAPNSQQNNQGDAAPPSTI
jgi:hypothetical protein